MRVFIFLHGADKKTFLQLKPKADEPIICADSGMRLLKELPYKPQKALLVGDLDSISKKEQEWWKRNKHPVQKYPINKDFTDGELAFMTACKNYNTDVRKVVLGGVSSLLDHTLGNIFSAVPFIKKNHNIIFVTEKQKIYLIRDRIEISSCKNHTFSLIPLEHTMVIDTKGLQWKLKNERISSFQSRTLRNKAIENTIEIHIKEGILLLIESW